jgi:hypothetical protein
MIWVGFVLLATMIIGVIIQANFEKKEWSNGFCKCGSAWKSFDMDSAGAIGYKCRSGHTLWLSWLRVDKAPCYKPLK